MVCRWWTSPIPTQSHSMGRLRCNSTPEGGEIWNSKIYGSAISRTAEPDVLPILVDGAHVGRRPEDENRLPVNIVPGHQSPHPTIVRRTPVIAQYEVFVPGNLDRRHGHAVP